MPTRNRDMPADLGLVEGVNDYGEKVALHCTGETKRERAARSAMQGLLALQGAVLPEPAVIGKAAVEYADALHDALDEGDKG